MIESFKNIWPLPKDAPVVTNTFAALRGDVPNPKINASAPICLSCGASPSQDGTLPCDH